MGQGKRRHEAKAFVQTTRAAAVGSGGSVATLFDGASHSESITFRCDFLPSILIPRVGSSVILAETGKDFVEVFLDLTKIGTVTSAGSAVLRRHYLPSAAAGTSIQSKIIKINSMLRTFIVELD